MVPLSEDRRSTNGAEGLALGTPAGRWVVAVAVAGSSMAFLDGTVVNVALPRIGRDLGASTGQLQWVLTGYLLTLASLILLGGSLADRYGRRRVFTIGVVVFTAASVCCAAAPTIEALIVARVLQGVGASLLTPGSLAMIESSFRPDHRARAIGAWSGLTGVATAIGPILGGYLVTAVSWRAVFFINVPVGGFVIVSALRHLPESSDPTAVGRLDVRGAALATVGLGAVTFALIGVSARGVAISLAIGAVGIAALVGLLVVERRQPNPMLSLKLFESRQFSAANGVTFVVYAALGRVFFLLVAYLQIVMGYSPIAAGASMLPVTMLMLLLSARSGGLAQRIGPRLPLTVGPFVIAAGLLLMGRIEPGDAYAAAVLPAVVVFGLGLVLVVAPITATVLAAADVKHAGVASGINNAVARVAGLLAVAVLPVVAGLGGDRFYDVDAMATGFRVAMMTCAALAVCGGALAWSTIRNDVLDVPSELGGAPVQVAVEYSCAVCGPPAQTRPGGPSGVGAA